jgi:hypothetical protein
MYLRAILCTFQIYVDFYNVPVDGGGGGLEREGWRGESWRGGGAWRVGHVIYTVRVCRVSATWRPVTWTERRA